MAAYFCIDFLLLGYYNYTVINFESSLDMILRGYLFSLLYAAICLGIGFLVYKIPGVSKKITRKIVHILIGAEWFILYHFFGGGIHFLAVCLLFLVLLAISYRKKLMPMISSDDDNSPGTVYYGVAMTIMAAVTMFVPDMIIPFGIGVFCTSLGDGLAGLMGYCHDPSRYVLNRKIYGNKTLYGTVYNFALCCLAAYAFNIEFALGMSLFHCLAIALFSTELELFTGKGLDNISITLGSSFLSYFFIHFEGAENFIVPILLTPLIIAFAYKKKALTIDGIVAAVIVDIIISFALGNFGFIILLVFFLGGILADKVKKHSKKAGQNKKVQIEKRGECRDHVQVLANSLVACALACLYFFSKNEVFVIAFIASFAEALADTTASGVGALSNKTYDLFRMRKCAPGESGGMSLLGTLSSLITSCLMGSLGFLLGLVSGIDVVIVILSAFLGAVFDSLLGSLLQVKYICSSCGAIVETEEHCHKPTTKHRGIRLINNDVVNLLSTLFAAMLAFFMSYK